VQVGRRDHEQRRAVDAVVGEPVADQRAALERGRSTSWIATAICRSRRAALTARLRPRGGTSVVSMSLFRIETTLVAP
jgi:hypothetical protein